MKRLLVSVVLAFIVGLIIGGRLVAFRLRSKVKAQQATSASDPTLDMLVADTNSPVKFNAEVGEYQLAYQAVENGSTGDVEYVLRFSPFTGAPLPSRRAELFMEASPAEAKVVREKLKGARTLAEVEKALGKPDDVFNNGKTFKTQYSYTRAFKTLVVIVQEASDGRISFTYYGKEKPRAKQ